MKKKWIIALSVVLVVVVTIVTLSFTLFTVQNFKIDMRTGSSYDYNEQEIFASSQLQTGKNIFFLNKTQASSNIEKAYPYLKVINIETQFPSTLVFHLAERQAFYAVRSGEGWLYLDEDLKVLESVAAPENVVVVEAGLNSGALITAELAAAGYGKVMAVPGNINSPYSIGSNKLISDGVAPVVVIGDVLESMGIYEVDNGDNNLESVLGNAEKEVYMEIKFGEEISVDEVCRRVKRAPGYVNGIIAVLEMKGLVRTSMGKVFVAK